MHEQGDAPQKRPAPRRRGQQPVIADVAQRAGVSPMTVSRVMNSAAGVSAKTRAAVQQAIQDLGYIPNMAAQNLAGGQLLRIAIIYSNPSASYLSELLVGCLAQASISNVSLMLEHYSPDEQAADVTARLLARGVDAIVLPPPLCDDAALIHAINAQPMPMARIATGAAHLAPHAVTVNDQHAAMAMTDHLLALGHRRIAFITGDARQSASALRLDGYCAALQQAGVPVDRALIATGDFSYRSGLVAAGALLRQSPRPSAIFACNDDMAAAVIAVAHRMDIAVPDALSVCGFDDSAMATSIWPEITTIRQPVADMAKTAIAQLTDILRAGHSGTASPPAHTQLAFELVRRQSCARYQPGA
ncbi:MAG: LacI family DNA-binding transcriptional regulator [Sphingopyxis sp.]